MPFVRFKEIQSYSRLYDEELAKQTGESVKGHVNYDPNYKVTPCLKCLLLSSQQNMNPMESVAIDECILGFKVFM